MRDCTRSARADAVKARDAATNRLPDLALTAVISRHKGLHLSVTLAV
jgi:hypothetical protein